MTHVVLLGDSVFDNAAYTSGGPDVLAHLRALLPRDARADSVAVDGATTSDIGAQVARVPRGATRLVLSVGGNDALRRAEILHAHVEHAGQALLMLESAVAEFAAAYRRVLQRCLALRLPLTVCTIYEGNFADPDYRRAVRAGVAAYDDTIYRSAGAAGADVIDLRDVCSEPAHYANPIEPSVLGGRRIAQAIVERVLRR